jgi:uncharacterized protein (UPF0276 family)
VTKKPVFAPVKALAEAATGIGLREPHATQILSEKPAAGFLEAHSENYFRIGGIPFEQLLEARSTYPISLHGVGLSLGTAGGVSLEHLARLAELVRRVEPVLVSEHISWSSAGGRTVPDLLPLPMTKEALAALCANIDRVQEALGRAILVENPSSYLAFTGFDMTEPAFITETAKRTGCGLLLDVNNIHVSAHNLGFDARAYLKALPRGIVGEIHLAGYEVNAVKENEIFIDAHNHAVYPAVWELYAEALGHFGDVPTLVEWDSDLPPLNTLLGEAKKADGLRKQAKEKGHVRVA